MRTFALVVNSIVILWVVVAVISSSFLGLHNDSKGTMLIFIILTYAFINLLTIFRLKPNKAGTKEIKNNET